MSSSPNVVFVFADQWRAQSTGYAGDPYVHTPNLDRLARESVCFTNAISNCPVCSPYRASLLTGQYPLTHGVFTNDVHLSDDATSLAEAYAAAGYDTAYIGKWHVDGRGRSSYIPPERRQGFDFWKVLECTHDYQNSPYYGDGPEKLKWEGYDAIAQTQEAIRYLKEGRTTNPFLLVLSWGPPHNPFGNAPAEYEAMYKKTPMLLRPNVPAGLRDLAEMELRGYYAHIAALDFCLGEMTRALEESGLADDTIFVFTSDHGDMLGSQGVFRKQKPWEESISVPFLLRHPAAFGRGHKTCDKIINAPDIMPTLLGLSGIAIPPSVEGDDCSPWIRGERPAPDDDAALIACYHPFGEFLRSSGGKEYRGVRTTRYTYAKDLEGPWLLYDNQADPCQMHNLVDSPAHAAIRERLEGILAGRLEATNDKFEHADVYLEKWGYEVDASGTVPYGP